MELNVTVGVLADRMGRDKDQAASIEQELAAVNAALKQAGLKRHKEKKKAEPWSARMQGHYALHALREVAARIAAKEDLPKDRQIDGAETPGAEKHFADVLEHVLDPNRPGAIAKLFGSKRRLPEFAHLCFHSDSTGYYVPVDFKTPIIPKDVTPDTKHLWPLGSSQRLLQETTRLAKALVVPDGMTHDDNTLKRWREGEDETPSAPWQAHPVAAHACLILQDAARRSVKSRAAIHFG